jgi:hypothetical protein
MSHSFVKHFYSISQYIYLTILYIFGYLNTVWVYVKMLVNAWSYTNNCSCHGFVHGSKHTFLDLLTKIKRRMKKNFDTIEKTILKILIFLLQGVLNGFERLAVITACSHASDRSDRPIAIRRFKLKEDLIRLHDYFKFELFVFNQTVKSVLNARLHTVLSACNPDPFWTHMN